MQPLRRSGWKKVGVTAQQAIERVVREGEAGPKGNAQSQNRTAVKRLAGQEPFVEDLIASYYCALILPLLCACAVSYSQRWPTSSFDGVIDR